MSRLIDADKLNEEFQNHYEVRNPKQNATMDEVCMMLFHAPTVDAVPVVRCRECIAYTPVDDNTGKCVFLIGKHQYVVPDGYCYLGEQKEGAGNDT